MAHSIRASVTYNCRIVQFQRFYVLTCVFLTEATSSIKNSIGWYKFGGFGILFFNGAYSAEQLSPYFQEACDFFDESVNEEETLLLIGHWNGNETIQSWISPYGGQVVTPRARELLLDLPGCSHLGKRIIYFDGHGHTNVMVPGDNGYLAGGHGIMGELTSLHSSM